MRKITKSPSLFRLFGFVLFGLLMMLSTRGLAQSTLVTELVGSPPDFTDWTTVDIDTQNDQIILTQPQSSQTGALFFSTPYNLNQCLKWKVEFDFRMYDGNSHADGLAFWFLENPPTSYGQGQSLGMPDDGLGLKVAFDTYDNDNGVPGHTPNPEIQVYYGLGYDETFPEPDMLKAYASNLNSSSYQHAIITWDDGTIEISIDGEEMLTGTPTPFNGAEDITEGYFGFSASTGLYYDKQSIKNVKVYIDVLDLESDVVDLSQCDLDGDGFAIFDLTSVEDEFIDNDDAVFEYFTDYLDALAGENPIDDPTTYENQQEGADEYVYVKIANQNGCSTIAFLHLFLEDHVETLADEVEMPLQCVTDGQWSYDLTTTLSGFVNNPENYAISFYENEDGAINGADELALENPEAYVSALGQTTIYVRIQNLDGVCFVIVTIVLKTYQIPEIMDLKDLTSCEQNEFFIFNLTENNALILGDQDPDEFEITYYLSQEDADLKHAPIEDPENYTKETAGCDTIYVRIENNDASDCYVTNSFEVCSTTINIGDPTDLEMCFDESNSFDLTGTYEQILNGESQEDFSISFFTSLGNAQNDENPIVSPTNYQPQEDTATIFFRVESETNPDCFEIGSFTVRYYYISVSDSGVELKACADENFDLTQIEGSLDLSGDQYITGYYGSLEDFEADTKISDPVNYTINTQETLVYVTVEGSNMICPNVYSVSLTIRECEIFIPEGFSPNRDGINDYFEISNLDAFPNYSLKIYSRYGRLLYDGKSGDTPWDGTSKNGNDIPSGVYYYVLNLKKDNRIEKGWVYLNR